MSGYLALLQQMDAEKNTQGGNCINRVKALHGLRRPDIDEKKSSEPIYRRLLALAPAAGLDPDAATYSVGVRVGILSEYASQPDDVLADCLRGWALERPALCATCGPVWLPPHWPRRVACCPWCASKRAGRPIPRPPFGPGDRAA